jgi:cell division transport system permease protein
MAMKTRYGTNFISSVLSIGLVLFMLGLIGVIILHGQELARHVRENIVVTVMLKDNVREADMFALQKTLDSKPMVLSTLIVSPEEAADRLTSDTGEDFISFLGYIPLPHSIDVHVKSEFANRESLEQLETDLKTNAAVKDVYFDKDLTDVINDNVGRISIILSAIALLLLLITIVLINNTMRLHIYSRRFLIKSMLLVGASHGFIRKPFLSRGFWIGIAGSALAIVILFGSLSFFQKQIPDLKEIFMLDAYIILMVIIIAAGIIISVVSSAVAVRKYVRLDQDSLYR